MNIIFNLLYLFLGTGIGFFLFYLIIRPKLHNIKQINISVENTNKQLQKDNESLVQKKDSLLNDIQNYKDQIEILKNSIQDLKLQAEQASEEFYNSNYKLAQERLDQAAQLMSEKYQQYEEECKSNYLQVCQESSIEYQNSIQSLQNQIQYQLNLINESNEELKQLKANIYAATQENIRKAQMQEENNFYRINLNEQSIKEIEKIKEIIPYLTDSEPINKVIWKVYYEKPTSDLVNRVIGKDIKSGIYKITDIASGKCYVGQSVNVGERFKQHIKRGLGAETPTKNKLYPAMQEIGVENFTFEFIEECPKDKLDEQEDYWQEFFEAKTWGYSIK